MMIFTVINWQKYGLDLLVESSSPALGRRWKYTKYLTMFGAHGTMGETVVRLCLLPGLRSAKVTGLQLWEYALGFSGRPSVDAFQ